MKKLAYTLILIFVVALSSCKSHNLSVFTKGVKTLSRCCSTVSSAPTQTVQTFYEEDETITDKAKTNNVSYLPVYTWDTKMMFW
jgi:hypothetical protein